MSRLLDHTIWWQIFPLGALGAPIRDRTGDDAARLKLVRLHTDISAR